MEEKGILLPKLDRLSPTLESTLLKLLEEAGELAQAVGKFRGMNGERVTLTQEQALQIITRELLDVAQTTVSMMFVLEEQYGVDLKEALRDHLAKLEAKGYLSARAQAN
ncbi:MAG TPA: nucleotide pyrophosphohydrolase [Firmicutes bacterium]|nr:nucleotide pyrophosphohydrolase [Bacillota bacterium]